MRQGSDPSGTAVSVQTWEGRHNPSSFAAPRCLAEEWGPAAYGVDRLLGPERLSRSGRGGMMGGRDEVSRRISAIETYS